MIIIESNDASSSVADTLPDVWCVIPHFGDDKILERCHVSLNAVNYPEELFGDHRIVVVNNNPPNENLLFTAAVNKGILYVQRERRRLGHSNRCLIWILNNDTVVEPDCVREAARCFVETGWERTGIVGPRNVLLTVPDHIIWGGSKRIFPSGEHKTGSVNRGDLNVKTEEEWVTFSAPFLNADMIEEIGVLDHNLAHVASDSDYCLRARSQGWQCFYEPRAVVRHAVGTSNRNANDWLQQQMAQDMQYFTKKWLQPGGLFASLTQYPVNLKNGQFE